MLQKTKTRRDNRREIRMKKQQKPTAKRPKAQATKSTFDAFGGRIGSRMSAVNVVVINAGKKGATVQEVATATGEASEIVSAQLGWMVNHKKVATRKAE